MTAAVSSIFATQSEASGQGGQEKQFGYRYRGRYHMPLLPGEQGTKSGGNWVPYGIQSVTNMLDGFEDQRGLQMWEQEGIAYGFAKQPSLYEEACLLVAEADRAGIDFSRLGDTETGQEIRRRLTGGGSRDDAEVSVVGRAKQAAGFNEARQAGTNRHTAWEHWCATGELIGTPEMREQITAMVTLLADSGLEVIPSLAERVVRNTMVNTAGRFDNILRAVRDLEVEVSAGKAIPVLAGTLIMADLKTKRKPFRSFASVEGQLACYARSEHMLTPDLSGYEPGGGPIHHVDLRVGAVLIMPSDGSEPYLKPADLEYGWEVAQHARRTLELRSHGSSTAHTSRQWLRTPNNREAGR